MEHTAVMAELAKIDGARGTWSWMLEKGNRGYGLVPWVSNPLWWDQYDQIYSVTGNIAQPIFTPAIVEWRAPEDVDNEWWEVANTALPYVAVQACATFGSYTLDEGGPIGTAALNIIDYWHRDDDSHDFSWFGLPLWQITPIDEQMAWNWSECFNQYWSDHPETRLIPFLSGNGMEHGEYEIDGETYVCAFDDGQDCTCGLDHDMSVLYQRAYQGWYFPTYRDPNDTAQEFWTAWDWGLNRYIQATSALHELVRAEGESYPCLSSWVSSQSPFSDTRPSSAWTHVAEPESSTHSTSSQPSLDFSTAA